MNLAAGGKTYYGPPIDPNASKKLKAPSTQADFAEFPVFLGPDGNTYDVNYIQVEDTKWFSKLASSSVCQDGM